MTKHGGQPRCNFSLLTVLKYVIIISPVENSKGLLLVRVRRTTFPRVRAEDVTYLLTLTCGRNAAQVHGRSTPSRMEDALLDRSPSALPPLLSPSPSLLVLLLSRLDTSTEMITPVFGLKTRTMPSPQHATRNLHVFRRPKCDALFISKITPLEVIHVCVVLCNMFAWFESTFGRESTDHIMKTPSLQHSVGHGPLFIITMACGTACPKAIYMRSSMLRHENVVVLL